MNDVVIAAAARTPIGAFNGGLSSVPAHYLGQVAIEGAMRRAAVEPGEVDEVIMGQILAAGEGQNPARQAAVHAGIPVERTAYGVNQLCGSGLRTVALGYQAIRVGDSDVVVAGGHESMSQAPHCLHMRNGTKMGATELVDTMLRDGLFDAFNGYHMGTTAENVAERWQITRDQQDAFAAASQRKAEDAQNAGRFAEEIVPVTIRTRKGEKVVDTDEHPKHGTTVETLAKLRPAFAKDGTVTAGNASGINDGGAALVLVGALLAPGTAPGDLLAWTATGILSGGLLLGAYVWVLRAHPALVVVAAAAMTVPGLLERAMEQAYAGALVGSLAGAAAVSCLAWRWFTHLAPARE